MKNLIRLLFIFIFSGIILSIGFSCSEDKDCSITGRPMVNCVLYKMDRENKAVKNDTLDSLTVTAFGTDSIIINNQKKVHTLSLPLRFTSDSTVLVFHYDYKRDPANSDTIYIKQSNIPYFESMECGYIMEQTIIKAKFSENLLDSIYILNKNANTNGTENIKLFYR